MKTAIQVKYSKEGCFSFGVARVASNGNGTGMRLKPFNYTDRRVLSINDIGKKVKAGICRVRSLEHTDRKWVSHSRANGELYLDDPVSKVSGLGKVAESLLHENDLKRVDDLFGLAGDGEAIKDIFKSTKGLGKASLLKWIDDCACISAKLAPEVEYYINTANLYAAKYGTEKDEWGEEAWEKEIKKSAALKPFVDIKDLVKHIISETKIAYQDTEHKDTYYWHHDALSQLTAGACIEWIKNAMIPGEDTTIHK